MINSLLIKVICAKLNQNRPFSLCLKPIDLLSVLKIVELRVSLWEIKSDLSESQFGSGPSLLPALTDLAGETCKSSVIDPE